MLKKLAFTHQAIFVCTLAATFYCYEYYLRVTPSVISQDLMSSFNISNAGLGLLSAMFYYAYMPLQIPVGLLIDKFGTRSVLTAACLLCVFGCYLFANTNSLLLAQSGRFIIGFGSAFAFVGFLKICTNWLPHKYYASMVGLCMLLGMIGAMGGEILLSELLQNFTWQQALQLSAIFGLILSLIMYLGIRDTPDQTTKTEKEPVLTGLISALRNPNIWLIGIIGCCTFLPLSAFAEMWAIPFLEVIGYSKAEAALGSSFIFLGFGLGGPFWGIMSNILASRRIPLLIGSLTSASCATLIILHPTIPMFYMFSTLFFLGFFSGAEILVFAIGNDLSFANNSGTTTALINMIVMIGGITLQPIIGLILDVISSTSVSQYQTALLVLPISLFIAAGLSFSLQESFKA